MALSFSFETETEARETINALANYGNLLSDTDSTRPHAQRLDETRHRLERAVDEHTEAENASDESSPRENG